MVTAGSPRRQSTEVVGEVISRIYGCLQECSKSMTYRVSTAARRAARDVPPTGRKTLPTPSRGLPCNRYAFARRRRAVPAWRPAFPAR